MNPNQDAPNQSNKSDRPFTEMIDRMIAKERNQDPSEIELELNNSMDRCSQIRCDKYFGIGPLLPPKLSSTSKSEADNPHGPSHMNGEFRPLLPEESPFASPKVARRQVTDVTDALNEARLAERASSPQKRQQEIAEQRQALLAEQERLKAILDDQEQLLRQKQAQLHLQQELHKQRLQCFSQTGCFPNPPQGHFLYPYHGLSNIPSGFVGLPLSGIPMQHGCGIPSDPPKQAPSGIIRDTQQKLQYLFLPNFFISLNFHFDVFQCTECQKFLFRAFSLLLHHPMDQLSSIVCHDIFFFLRECL